MRTFLNKHWKMVLVFLLTLSLTIAIIKIRSLEGKLNESLAAVAVINKRIEYNNQRFLEYQTIVDSLTATAAEHNVVVITKTDLYEKTKNSPITTTLTDRELVDRLKKFRARYEKNNGRSSN